MKSDWLREFSVAVNEDLLQDPSVVSVHVVHRRGDAWFREDVQEDFCWGSFIAVGESKRNGSGRCYAFMADQDDLVVVVGFSVSARKARVSAVAKSVARIMENSRHRFDAFHDVLTGCKNRKSFDMDLARAMLRVSSPTGSDGSGSAPALSQAVFLVSIDLDYFKRINDSRGHDYGDVVLRAFSWLVQDFCASMTQRGSSATYELYRMGGEEFCVLIVGSIDEKSAIKFSESVRLEISRAVVPSNLQLTVFGSNRFDSIPELERRITASLGVSRLGSSELSKSPEKASERLKNQSDKALYSAKASGRDCVRYFPDILKRFGRVLEFDRVAGVVVIDIGSEVGVVKGREFFVIPEKYTGDKDYVVDDGRTQRTLGRYPRLKNAKIVAFDVQSEISFCTVTDSREGVVVEAGDLLESIPLGLFGGLSGVYGAGESFVDSELRPAAKRWMDDDADANSRVVVIRFEDVREVERDHGAVRANEILAGVAGVAKRSFPAPVRVVQAELGQFGVAFSCGDDIIEERLDILSQSLRELCSDFVSFTVGVFDRAAIEKLSKKKFILVAESAYDYAVIAAAAAGKNSWRFFDEKAPAEIIAKDESNGDFDKVLANHARFKGMGIVGASIDNSFGLANFQLNNIEMATSAFRSAMEFSPEDPIVRSNLSVAYFSSDRLLDAYDVMKSAIDINGGKIPVENVMAMFALASLESCLSRGFPLREDVEKSILAADALDFPFFVGEERYRLAKDRFNAG